METSDEEFLDVVKTHVLGTHALTRAVLPGMLRRRHGSIIFIASMASLFGVPNVFAYSAAKSAYPGMVRALATEVSPAGVRVNAIAPGWNEFEGVVIPDHAPQVSCAAPWHAGMACALGYLRAGMQACGA